MSNNFDKENIVILSLFGMFFGIIVLFYADYVHEDVYAMIYASPIIVCVVISLSLSYHYKKSRDFSLAFLFFGLSMLSLLIAEIMWVIMPYFEIPQYESYPDIFYLGYAVLSLIFPWFVLRHYKICLNIIHYLIILLITIVGILTYVELSNNNDLHSSSFSLGLVFAVLTSFLTGISTIMLFVLKNTKIFRVWMIIAFSLFISALSDIWYYASENTEDWSGSDFTNIVWFASYLIMIYALGEQRHSYVIIKKSFKQVKEKKSMENNSKESDYRFIDRFLEEEERELSQN